MKNFMIEMLIWLILAGLVTGILSGLLGIGGGVVTVPAIYYVLDSYGFPKEELMRVAAATALAATFITSMGSTWAHHKKLAIAPSLVKLIIPGLIIGCAIGAPLARFLPSSLLRTVFGAMTLLFALYFFFPKLTPPSIAPHPNRSLTLFGVLFGSLSTLLGIGGGIFMIPTLLGYHVSLRSTVAASSVGTLVTAFCGSLAYLIIAWGSASLPYTVGYIEIPAFLSIGICSFFTSFLGVKLAHTLPTDLIKRIFALVLAVTGLVMILGK